MLKLEVGKSYLNGMNEIVKIETNISPHECPDKYTFISEDYQSYTSDGKMWSIRDETYVGDLVSETKDKNVQTTSHEWEKEIKAWADGAKIEYRKQIDSAPIVWGMWKIAEKPQWWENSRYEYRVVQNPDYELRGHLSEEGIDWSGCDDCTSDNIVGTFDGVTKKLKKVEML